LKPESLKVQSIKLRNSPARNLKLFLDSRVDLYNQPAFVATDPIQIPHLYKNHEDIEISAFLTATLSWGQRKTIINKSGELMKLLDNRPYYFITHAPDKSYERFDQFCHRTFNATDTLYFLRALKNLYSRYGSLKLVFERGFKINHDAEGALNHFRNCFFETEFPNRTAKHVSDVSHGSSAKRLNMFLRWMVRNDNRGVDFGIWKNIDPAWLCIPLDVHVGNTARKLQLLKRNQDDWKAVCELTSRLRTFDRNDPVKYDFALFGLSAFEEIIF
jgi:uncharacterized protein (TIGR02757 family)